MRHCATAVVLFLLAVVLAPFATAGDWPTFGHDAARSNVTTEQVAWPAVETWSYRPSFGPRPAWSDPKPEAVEGILELRRVHFDDVFQPIIARGRVYFGSSSDNKVYCLDASSGTVLWTAITGGPVRLAPSYADGKLYVGSDDGHVRALDAATGKVVWNLRAAPEDRRVLGHGRMISAWPVRTGVLVDGGTAYFGAGIFPAEGVFLYAADAATGRVLWCNDQCGEQPQSRISPQGYLLASPTALYVPMARVSPVAFNRRDGKLSALTYFGKTIGGTYALVAGEQVFTGTEQIIGYQGDKPTDRFAAMEGHRLLVRDDRAYLANGKELIALDRKNYPAVSRKLYAVKAKRERMTDALGAAKTDRSNLNRDKARAESELALVEQDLARTSGAKKADLQAEQQKLRAEIASLETKLERWKIQFEQQQATAKEMEAEIERLTAEVAKSYLWSVPCKADEAMVLAGDKLLLGGSDEVAVFDAASGKQLGTLAVEGKAKGLAVAGGTIIVSTDAGKLCAFGAPRSAAAARPATAAPAVVAPATEQAAEAILKRAGVSRGFCLVYGCENGELALALARRSELMIYAVDASADKVAASRRTIDAAGYYGGRICVEQWPWGELPYADYFANLIVSETALATGRMPGDAAEVHRLLKPLGGTAVLGPAKPALAEWASAGGMTQGRFVDDGRWWHFVRGVISGAGSWTHLYANPGNTACGDDRVVKCPLGLLWFGEPGPGNMVSRHERAAGPLSIGGRLFCQGSNWLAAFDVYNGVKYWERKLEGAYRPNASHDGGNLAAADDGLYAAVRGACQKIDPATGETQHTYKLPDAGPGRWGYIALEHGLLYGSRAPTNKPESDQVFAIEPTGDVCRWKYEGAKIPHNTICLEGGRLYLVETGVTTEERDAASAEDRQIVSALPVPDRKAAKPGRRVADVRKVTALDAQTGKVLWQRPLDVTHCGGAGLAAMAHDGVLIVFGVYLDGHYWQQFFAGDFAARRVTALDAKTGKLLWSKPVGYRVRPLIVGDTLHAEPWAFHLRTGQQRHRTNPITGVDEPWQFARPGHHCGCPSASPNCLFFRSYALGYYDLLNDFGTQHFGAQRSGCWINFIAAAGLALVPEASAGCMCPFPNMCTVVFQPTERQKGFGWYSASGPSTPVKRLALDLGAAGDRKDASGQLWLGVPRPGGSLVMPLKVDVTFAREGGFVARNSTYTAIEGTKEPWIFASAARGITRCAVPLVDPGDGEARYRVTLLFADPDNDKAGHRVFDVKLQGRTVLGKFDIAREAGGKDRAIVKQFGGIAVAGKLMVEFKAPANAPLDRQPILQGLLVERERVDAVGCHVPPVELSDARPRAEVEVRLSNFKEEPFEGRIEFGSVDGFSAAPSSAPVHLAVGQRATVRVDLSSAARTAPGNYALPVRLVRSNGQTETEGKLAIEHLGPRTRLVVKASEDAYASQRYPEMNKGNAAVMLVDGGAKTVGDVDHSRAFLKFPLDLPGRPVRAVLCLHNAGNLTSDSGRVCLVESPWSETEVTYTKQPSLGRELCRIGRVAEWEVVERALPTEVLAGRKEISLAIDPTSTDGTDYLTREGGRAAELIIECESAGR